LWRRGYTLDIERDGNHPGGKREEAMKQASVEKKRNFSWYELK